MEFYRCEECDGISLLVSSGGCCYGEDKMIIPKVDELNKDHHLPKYQKEGNKLRVYVEHEMSREHFIDWIFVKTKDGGMIKKLKDKAEATFNIDNEEVVAIYALCNKHGLWIVEL